MDLFSRSPDIHNGVSVHVESIALLERVSSRKADSYVKLNVKMEDYYRIKDSADTGRSTEVTEHE